LVREEHDGCVLSRIEGYTYLMLKTLEMGLSQHSSTDIQEIINVKMKTYIEE